MQTLEVILLLGVREGASTGEARTREANRIISTLCIHHAVNQYTFNTLYERYRTTDKKYAIIAK